MLPFLKKRRRKKKWKRYKECCGKMSQFWITYSTISTYISCITSDRTYPCVPLRTLESYKTNQNSDFKYLLTEKVAIGCNAVERCDWDVFLWHTLSKTWIYTMTCELSQLMSRLSFDEYISSSITGFIIVHLNTDFMRPIQRNSTASVALKSFRRLCGSMLRGR